ncbi:MAG: queuosine precursor transporter [Pseudomonadota bacterium]|nr:queuosine precursor transporter [Pseudomonadota bacterium]
MRASLPPGLPNTPGRHYKYFDFVMAAYVVILVCADVIGPGKVSQVQLPVIGEFTFGAGVLFFPISYIFGDMLTEVYGYARARRVVWAGFAALAFASFMSWVVVSFPPAPGWPHQAAYEATFGSTPRIIAASLLAVWAGEFANSFTLARMKVATEGRWMWTRFVGSTVVGEAVDSALFYPIAFYGVWPDQLVVTVMLTNYLLKTGWEIVMYPVTRDVVLWMKRVENEDWYDRDTDFNPFVLDAD